jgi:release factor glutamine methyltransferase
MLQIELQTALSRADAQRRLTQVFTAAGIETAALDARIILCAGLGIDHLALVREPERPLGAEAHIVSRFAQRRIAGEPVSRILGHREFYGLDFAISPAVLDPRPETEILVEAALAAHPRHEAPLRVIDFGVGSGAILAALLSYWPAAFGFGLDQSEAACRVAQTNLARLGLRARSRVVCCDWAEALIGAFDVIVANPPYIATADISGLGREVREHDPHVALDGGADGLAAYRVLVPAAARCLARNGFIAFEVGAGQAETVAALLAEASLTLDESKRDLGGHVRVVTATKRE